MRNMLFSIAYLLACVTPSSSYSSTNVEFDGDNHLEYAVNAIPLVRINLTDDKGLFKQTIIGWVSGISDDVLNRTYDASLFDPNAKFVSYTIKQNTPLAIQGVSFNRKRITLGFNVDENYTYTFVMDRTGDPTRELYLVDYQSGNITNLAIESYSFNSVVGIFKTRFDLFTSLDINKWDGSTWSKNRAPIYTDDVMIAGDYDFSIDGAFDSNHLLITEGATLNVDDLSTLTVYGDLVNRGSMTVSSGASLITYSTNKVEGNNIVFKRNTRYGNGKYSFVGSPVKQNASITGADLGRYIYRYDESKDYATSEGLLRWIEATNDVLVPGVGYTQAFQKELSFSGMPNSNTVNYAGSYTGTYGDAIDESTEGWNLIANPYPAAISVDTLLSLNTNLVGAVYIWDDNNSQTSRGSDSDYLIVNSVGVLTQSTAANGARYNGHLASGQGFFVKLMNDQDTVITFTEAMRVVGQNQDDHFFRKEESMPKIRISLTDENGLSRQTLIGRVDWISDNEINRMYDAPLFGQKAINNIFSIKMGASLAIQGVSFDRNAIELGYHVDKSNMYRLSVNAENFSEEQIWILDRFTNDTINMVATSYTFQSDSGSFNERFVLLFENKAILANQLIEHAKIYVHNNVLFLKPNQSISDNMNRRISLYDLVGNEIFQTEVSGATTIDLSYLKPGIYIVNEGNKRIKINVN
jgi:hypothetical protein